MKAKKCDSSSKDAHVGIPTVTRMKFEHRAAAQLRWFVLPCSKQNDGRIRAVQRTYVM